MKRACFRNSKILSILVGFAILSLSSVDQSHAETALKPEKKAAAVESLDARINNLQEARDCIDAAKTKEAVKACRANIKSAKKNLKKLREESGDTKPTSTPIAGTPAPF